MPESMIKDRPEDPKRIVPFAVYYAGRGRLGRAATGDGRILNGSLRCACGMRRQEEKREATRTRPDADPRSPDPRVRFKQVSRFVPRSFFPVPFPPDWCPFRAVPCAD